MSLANHVHAPGFPLQLALASAARAADLGSDVLYEEHACVKVQAHLCFDEQEAGPAAGSSLGGPVGVTGNATADTDNSSTVITVVTSCP